MNSQSSLQALRQTISRQVGLSAHEDLNIRCLTALERILSHVVTALDGDRDASMNAGDTQEAVLDALERARLLEDLTEEEEEPPVVDVDAVLARCRAHIPPPTRMLLALRGSGGDILTIEHGDVMGRNTRAGQVIARLLATPGDGPWYLVAMRPGTARAIPLRGEIEAAERIAAACRLVDVPLAGIYLDVRGPRGCKTHSLVTVQP